jgi:hypothetical protein
MGASPARERKAPVLVGKPVHHAQFGPGVVREVRGDTAYVYFEGARGRGISRKFLVEALFNDGLFPKAKNAEVWKTRGLKDFKTATTLKQVNETDAMTQALNLAQQPTKKRTET